MFVKTERNARHGIFIFAAVAATLMGAQWSSAAAQDRLPVKLEIVPSAHAVDVGAGVTLDVILRAADNGSAAAPKDLSVQLELNAPSGPVTLPSVVIAAGQSAAQVQFQITAPGMWAVRARNSELLEGGTVACRASFRVDRQRFSVGTGGHAPRAGTAGGGRP